MYINIYIHPHTHTHTHTHKYIYIYIYICINGVKENGFTLKKQEANDTLLKLL